jgi:hypothetical protein
MSMMLQFTYIVPWYIVVIFSNIYFATGITLFPSATCLVLAFQIFVGGCCS